MIAVNSQGISGFAYSVEDVNESCLLTVCLTRGDKRIWSFLVWRTGQGHGFRSVPNVPKPLRTAYYQRAPGARFPKCRKSL
jgi:hypothetical protein